MWFGGAKTRVDSPIYPEALYKYLYIHSNAEDSSTVGSFLVSKEYSLVKSCYWSAVLGVVNQDFIEAYALEK